ncbi:class I adenylate-forming enzyme family protein [Pseudonocardia pini]|uniref:class I adenylate-forming enzyme family protein n=1 Tax=Pseudonocardia pini TaxID=2758030 RepID=UPI0015F0723A|nr:AMP-binding protein [Pseudonocardia pini]
MNYPEVPVGAVLAGAARRWTDRVALHYGDRELTYTALYERACAFAHALREQGIRPGDVVAIHLPNCPQYAIAYYGIQLAGATFTPANPLLPPPDLAAQLADSGAVAIVSWEQASAAVPREGLRFALVTNREQGLDPSVRLPGQDFEEFHAGSPTTPPEVEIDLAGLAHLAYTGGTTGRSKGVMLPHRNVVTNVLQYACLGTGTRPALDDEGGIVLVDQGPPEDYPVRLGESVVVNITPWFHAMGTVGGLNIPLLSGTTSVLHERFDPAAYLADAERFRVTSLGGAPPLYAALLRHPDLDGRDLSSVRSLTSGAAPLAVEMIEALHRRLGSDVVVVEGYGLTEVTMGATQNPTARSAERRQGTVGLPVPDTEVRVVDAEGNPVPTGEPGEVCIRGPQVMTGYKDRPEETAATLRDGWLHSGDIGVLDADGYLRIVDRTKDMLLYKGYNVYPRELEELLFRQDGVVGAAVVGRPDPEVGELAVAFVVAPGRSREDAEAIRETVNAQVLPYKRIREIRLVAEIPVSAAGKVLKRELRELLR